MLRYSLLTALFLLPMSCDLGGADKLAECTDVCSKVEECSATPPTAEIGNWSGSSGSGGLDCGANCVQEDRAFYGYSDCQMTCIMEEECGAVNDCWKASSDVYAKHCLADRDIPEVEPDPADPAPENDTTSGSEQADDILKDPSSGVAIDESDFDVNYGDDPPSIVGHYQVVGEIDESANARPQGSPINTSICFWGQESLEKGSETSYCEYNVPGTASAPVTGSGNEFTIYLEYPGAATLLFSGEVDEEGHITQAETLVVYTHAVDVWEHSVTSWTYDGECDSCN